MKIVTATLLSMVVATACNAGSGVGGGGGGAKSPSYVMRVDRTYDRSSAAAAAVKHPGEDIGAESYKSEPPTDKWEVTIDGHDIVITAIGKAAERYEGHEVTDSSSTSAEVGTKRFDIDKGMFAGGRFILRGDDAELTTYGSGVPIVASDRGKLITR